jgi:hypothetical protein
MVAWYWLLWPFMLMAVGIVTLWVWAAITETPQERAEYEARFRRTTAPPRR